MTMLNRSAANASPALALTDIEIGLLDHLVNDKNQKPPRRKTLSRYLTKVARLGGYLARASDPPPGNMVMWRGMSRLTDIALGAVIGAKIMGVPDDRGPRRVLLRSAPASRTRFGAERLRISI